MTHAEGDSSDDESECHMGILRYSKRLLFERDPQVSGKETLRLLRRVIAQKRIGDLKVSGNRLDFRNLYLKRLDLLPIPKGWIQVKELENELEVTYSADYRWASNHRGRLLALIVALAMVWVTITKSMALKQLVGAQLSPWFFLAIPIYVTLFWFFVFSVNSWYSRLYLARLISQLLAVKSFSKSV